ncbi:hypothetical protein VTI74DRAFT_7052 [Chaetomium olivicolor]
MIFNHTYQVVAKLGYGSSSTWLCRDLRHHRYVAHKIYASGEAQVAREIAALRHINSVLAAIPPSKLTVARSIQTPLDQFAFSRPKLSRTNLCLFFEPLSVSLADMRIPLYGCRMPIDMVKCVDFYMLQVLDFLHRKAILVHAGELPDWNLKTSKKTTSSSLPSKIRRRGDDRPQSPQGVQRPHHPFHLGAGAPDARTADPGRFCEAGFGKESYDQALITLALGKFRKSHQITETSLEAEMTALEGDAKTDFLRFLRRMFEWDADNRPLAQELRKDP